MKITAAGLLADKRNTRAVLAAEVEKAKRVNVLLMDERKRFFDEHERTMLQSKNEIKGLMSSIEFWKSELKRVEQERDQLGHVIIAHAKKQAGF